MIKHNKINLKKEIAELKKIKTKERASDYKYLLSYVARKKGEIGAKNVKKALEKQGYILPAEDEIDDLDWLPLYLTNIYLVAAVKVFKWQEKDIIEMGQSLASYSPIIKFFIRHFLSTETTVKRALSVWKKYYSDGDIKMIRYNEAKKEIVFRIEKIHWHPFTCLYFIGSLGSVVELVIGRKVESRETKCPHKGDKYHEFAFYWK